MNCVEPAFIVDSMSEMSERLRQAREKAGHRSAQAAAEAMGIAASTYRAHENGQNEFGYREAQYYGRKFNVDALWILDGKERDPALKTIGKMLSGQFNIEQEKDRIPEIETRAGAGGGGVQLSVGDDATLHIGADAIKSWWEIPHSYLSELKVRQPTARIIEVTGDSMYDPAFPGAPGSIFPGDRLIIDTSDRRPSPAGPFAVWDGLGVVVKMVEVIQGTDPVRIRMISRNPRYSVYDATEDEAFIIGRVRARISIL
jgi:phage repressor protein C with HTH and peptisase S24 domain